MKYVDQFKKARRASVPIIIIRTPDYAITKIKISEALPKYPMLSWDFNRGVYALYPKWETQADKINGGKNAGALATSNPQNALVAALELMPPECILFMDNAHMLLETQNDDDRLTYVTSILNCRDPFKSVGSKRTLVLLCPDIKVPIELRDSVITLDAPLPDMDDLKAMAAGTYEALGIKPKSDQELEEAAGAVSGLSSFVAENSLAMSITAEGIDMADLWSRKISAINAVQGLSVSKESVTFDSLGGLQSIKDYGRDIINGKYKPRLVVLGDELEKHVGGKDSNGLNSDALGVWLSSMVDNNWDGIMLPGFPGTGKTEFCKAMGNECGGLFIKLDLDGMKDSLVGNSEKNIRAAMNTLLAMGGERVFFVATSNDMSSIPAELISRFSYGTVFFDLPTPEEQAPIWDIYLKKFNIPEQKLPKCDEWTGREIRKVCKLADELGISLEKASKRITPVVATMGRKVELLRESASGRYLSATNEGFYKPKSFNTNTVKRLIESK